MASKNLAPLADPEDMFADTRMSFGDHIEDLRGHLFRAIFGFLAAMILCIFPPIGPAAVKFITKPVEIELQEFYKRLDKNRPPLPQDVIDAIPPVRMSIRIHLPSFKKSLEERRQGKGNNAIPDAIEELLRRLDFDPNAANIGADDWDWIEGLAEIPNPIAFTKAVNDVNRIVQPKGLSTFSVPEAMTVYLKVGFMVGFVLSSPWVFYQIWSFVAAGLYPQEKKLVNYYLPFSVGLFLIGFFVCEFLVLPKAIEALLWFNEWLGFEPDLRLSEWLSFAIIMPLIFGLSFETPIVMLFLFKIGITDIDSFRNKRRIAYFLMAVFAALITPTQDIQTMMMMWVPMCLLYEVGIWLCIMQPKSLSEQMDEAELDEMVGV